MQRRVRKNGEMNDDIWGKYKTWRRNMGEIREGGKGKKEMMERKNGG
jgi:hypothetical protein